MSDKFQGQWLVSEYVFEQDGRFIGIVHQKRRVVPQDNGKIRVIQDCYPDAALAGHAMQSFAGHWEFDLMVEGRNRHYLGPAVVGIGQAWGKNATTGKGIWPKFGHNFQSFGIVPEVNRQLTGGSFYNAQEVIAKIIGLAYPEEQGSENEWPMFPENYQAALISKRWAGIAYRYDAMGKEMDEFRIQKEIDDLNEQDLYQNDESIHLISDSGILQGQYAYKAEVSELYGKQKQYGPYTERVLFDALGREIQYQMILDADKKQLLFIKKYHDYRHGETFTEIGILSATS